MKTMHKRVLAMLMALVLMFSCTAFASAAEATPEGLDSAPVASPANSDDGIMPLSEQTINTGNATSFDYGSFSIGLFSKRTPWVAVSAGENCVVAVTIKKSDGTLIKTSNINITVPAGENVAGMKIPLTDSALGSGTYRYEIRWNKTGIQSYWRIFLQW